MLAALPAQPECPTGHDPSAGYARCVCPRGQYEHCVPFSCKTRFCPACGKVRVNEWVSHIARDLLAGGPLAGEFGGH